MAGRPLTIKQTAFVQEYLVDLNASAACIRAGYSARSADKIGFQLLGNKGVAAAISDAMKAREKRTHITQDRVLQELARLAFADLRKVYREDGTMKLPHEWDDDTAAAMSGVDVTVTTIGGGEDGPAGDITTKKAKVFDKGAALTLAMRHLGMLNDKLQIEDITDRAAQMRARRERRLAGKA